MGALKEVFANKKLATSFNEFMLNKHFTIIPINP
jgi:predicted CoA-binding protein